MQQFFDTIQDASGNALPGATITVTLYPSGAASIYSDNGLTVIGTSIVTADSTGQVQFFAADGAYVIVYKNAGGTTLKTRSPVSLFDGAGAIAYADGGIANAYSTLDSRQEKALRVGLNCYLTVLNTSTTASTFAYNGLAAKTILTQTGNSTTSGTLTAGCIVYMQYNGTNWLIIQ